MSSALVDENEVRVAAGITLALATYAFCCAYFAHDYTPLRVVTGVFFLEFAVRATLGLRYSPVGQLARLFRFGREADLVSFRPKRFAWTMGLAMSAAMTVITNSGVHGWLPRSVCLVCMTLMWLEAVCGMCLGCQIHRLLVQRGLIARDPQLICAGGVCEVR
jgi:hypothetical protein